MSKENIENINEEVINEEVKSDEIIEEIADAPENSKENAEEISFNDTSEETIDEDTVEEISPEQLEQELEFDESEKTSLHDYVKLSDKYADLISSAYTMLLVGVLGAIFLILLIMDVIPINLGLTSWLFYTVMGLVFGSFIIAGTISLINALKLKEAAKQEDAVIDEIIVWADENIKLADIDDGLDLEDSIEELYFFRFARIKDAIMHQFETVDEPLIEELSEQVYQKLYESEDNEEIVSEGETSKEEIEESAENISE